MEENTTNLKGVLLEHLELLINSADACRKHASDNNAARKIFTNVKSEILGLCKTREKDLFDVFFECGDDQQASRFRNFKPLVSEFHWDTGMAADSAGLYRHLRYRLVEFSKWMDRPMPLVGQRAETADNTVPSDPWLTKKEFELLWGGILAFDSLRDSKNIEMPQAKVKEVGKPSKFDYYEVRSAIAASTSHKHKSIFEKLPRSFSDAFRKLAIQVSTVADSQG